MWAIDKEKLLFTSVMIVKNLRNVKSSTVGSDERQSGIYPLTFPLLSFEDVILFVIFLENGFFGTKAKLHIPL